MALAELPRRPDPLPHCVGHTCDHQQADDDAEDRAGLEVLVGALEFGDDGRKVLCNDGPAARHGHRGAVHHARLAERLDVGRERDAARPAVGENPARGERPDADGVALVAAKDENVAVRRPP